MPPEHNALGKLGKAMYDLECNPMPLKLVDAVIQMFKAQAPITAGRMGELKADPSANWEELQKICLETRENNQFFRTTTTPTMAQGSAQANILPEKASVITNSRLLPGDTLEELEAHFKAVLPEYVHFRLAKGHNPPSISRTDSDGFKVVSKVVRELHGEDVVIVPGLVAGGTDSRYYCPLSDSVYRFVGGKASSRVGGVHAVNEHIDTEVLDSNVEFFVRIIQTYGE